MLQSVLEQLEALAVSTAAGELTGALLPALEHTLACVAGPPDQAPPANDEQEGITGMWSCLADLFLLP